jgi:crotonobetainyl-CoA:carnitine CoA-transferase CaiB-like acyl-CoA transferase
MADAMTQLRAKLAAMEERAATPEFQARVAELDAAEADRLAHQREADRLRYLIGSGIPRAYWPHLEAPLETPALAAVRPLLEPGGPRVVILGGPRGRGKTTALAWLAYQWRGLFLEAQDTFRMSSFAEQDWRELAEAPTLALDECGAEFHGDALAGNLFSLLNARIQNLRPTALATNLNPTDFKARFLRGPMERLDDRLRAAGAWVSLPGESMRKTYEPPHPTTPWCDTDAEREDD